MPINFKGSEITGAVFDGKALDAIAYGGRTFWKRQDADPYEAFPLLIISRFSESAYSLGLHTFYSLREKFLVEALPVCGKAVEIGEIDLNDYPSLESLFACLKDNADKGVRAAVIALEDDAESESVRSFISGNFQHWITLSIGADSSGAGGNVFALQLSESEKIRAVGEFFASEYPYAKYALVCQDQAVAQSLADKLNELGLENTVISPNSPYWVSDVINYGCDTIVYPFCTREQSTGYLYDFVRMLSDSGAQQISVFTPILYGLQLTESDDEQFGDFARAYKQTYGFSLNAQNSEIFSSDFADEIYFNTFALYFKSPLNQRFGALGAAYFLEYCFQNTDIDDFETALVRLANFEEGSLYMTAENSLSLGEGQLAVSPLGIPLIND